MRTGLAALVLAGCTFGWEVDCDATPWGADYCPTVEDSAPVLYNVYATSPQSMMSEEGVQIYASAYSKHWVNKVTATFDEDNVVYFGLENCNYGDFAFCDYKTESIDTKQFQENPVYFTVSVIDDHGQETLHPITTQFTLIE